MPDIRAELHSFPANKAEALAMLYLSQRDLSHLSPEELLDKYDEAYDKICVHHKETRMERRNAGWSQKK